MAEPSPLNAAQVAQIRAHYEAQLQQIVAALNLRRWLVEKVIEKLPIVPDTDSMSEMLDKLHTFIVAPAIDGLKPPE